MQTACQSGFSVSAATPVAASTCRPRPSVPYEPMFDSSKNISTRLADAADLLIDFATLGEYGLEPVAKATPSCETRQRPASPASSATHRRRRPGAPTLVLAPEEPRPRRRHQIEGPFLLRP